MRGSGKETAVRRVCPGWNVGVDIELGKNLREVRSEFSIVQCGVCLNSVLNAKLIVGAFSQEKALVGAFSVIVQLHRWIGLQH